MEDTHKTPRLIFFQETGLKTLWMMVVILVFATSLSTVSSQTVKVTSTVSDGEVVCPGEEVILTCMTRDSIILIWISDEYIGDQIRFTTVNSLNETRRDSVYNSTIATFVNDTTEGGIRVLVSQLRIIISTNSLNPSVTCIDGSNNERNITTFQVLDDPDMFQATAHQSEDALGECTLYISWIPPTNIAIGDISRYMVSVSNGPEMTNFTVNNTNNDLLLSMLYPVCSCTTYNIIISAINRCDCKGQPFDIAVSPKPLNRDSVCENGGKTNPEVGSTNQVCTTAAAVLFALVVVILIIVVIAILIRIIYYYLKKLGRVHASKEPQSDSQEGKQMKSPVDQ